MFSSCLSKLKQTLRNYDAQFLLTKSSAAKSYGKKDIIYAAFIRDLKHPKVGWGDMYMYDTNVIEYYIKTNNK